MKYAEALELMFPYIESIYETYHSAVKEKVAAAEAAQPQKISCVKGCGACCHFPIIPATAGEAFVLLNRLLAGGKTIVELHALFFKYAESYFNFAREKGGLPFTDSQQRLFLKENLPCPLFVKTQGRERRGHCGVFETRPLICDYYHSLDSADLCLAKAPHRSFQNVTELGEEAVEAVRLFERAHFGRSALGHLPLLLAALCTRQGLELFLSEFKISEDAEPEAQAEADFEFYTNLLSTTGYAITSDDIHALIKAQEELT